MFLQMMCGLVIGATSSSSMSLHRRRLDEEADTSNRDADDYVIQMAEKRKGKSKKRSGDDDGSGGGGSGGDGASNKKGGGKGGRGAKSGGGGGRAGMWKQNFELLQNYHSAKGTAAVPLDYEDGEVKLGRWLRAIQKAWRDGKLLPEKVDQLKALGLESQPPGSGPRGGSGKSNSMAALKEGSKDRFQEFTSALVEYKRSNGHLQVPRSHVTEGGGVDEDGTTVGGGLKLGAWLAVHLTKSHNGGLDEGRHKELRKLFAQLGGDFDAASEKFAAIDKGAGKGGNAKGSKGVKGARKMRGDSVSEKSDD